MACVFTIIIKPPRAYNSAKTMKKHKKNFSDLPTRVFSRYETGHKTYFLSLILIIQLQELIKFRSVMI